MGEVKGKQEAGEEAERKQERVPGRAEKATAAALAVGPGRRAILLHPRTTRSQLESQRARAPATPAARTCVRKGAPRCQLGRLGGY
ncbi:hypothetical protein IscW_ISCW018352 [Ixodes scapularis]|uniref:Uncharacterized protein n=1 Tax=Ixodes scapularis TaxID=6945 RepID=B7PG60_IXOSC|nr:hypothetical protein IscW_ISCW018352 [Ixodes scapularis]|eukprot:XP_002434182.1 hypothetical protein IscW_ISCW018352 [Ixodes scapularis]